MREREKGESEREKSGRERDNSILSYYYVYGERKRVTERKIFKHV